MALDGERDGVADEVEAHGTPPGSIGSRAVWSSSGDMHIVTPHG
jgi:hypothetical protein